MHEAVEVCPHCDTENVLENWDVPEKGYIAICKGCGRQIFLCDECLHADDNRGMRCDWRSSLSSQQCFRGRIKA